MAKVRNIVEMIKSQVETGREVVGLIAESKVNANKRYALKNVNQGTYTFEEVVPEDEDRTPDTIKVNESNAQVMRYIVNPNAKPAPEAELKDGKLFVAGKEIPTGDLEVVKIFGGIEGNLFVGVKTQGEELNVYMYDVQFDKFTEQRFVDGSTFAVNLDGKLFLVENVIEEVTKKDVHGKDLVDADGNPVKGKVAKSVSVYNATNYGLMPTPIGDDEYDEYDEYDDEEDYDCYDPFNSVHLLPISNIRLIEQGHRKDIAVFTQYEEDEEGFICESEKTVVRLFEYDFANLVRNQVGTYVLNSADAEIYLGGSFGRAPVTTVVDDGQLIINDRFGCKIIDKAEVVDAIKNHPYFCATDVRKDDEDRNVVKFIYANRDNELAAFELVNTDRGQLVTLC